MNIYIEYAYYKDLTMGTVKLIRKEAENLNLNYIELTPLDKGPTKFMAISKEGRFLFLIDELGIYEEGESVTKDVSETCFLSGTCFRYKNGNEKIEWDAKVWHSYPGAIGREAIYPPEIDWIN